MNVSTPIFVTFEVQGLERLATALRGRLPDTVRKKLRAVVDRNALALLRDVKENWLTGPRPLKLGVVTGTLRRSINMKRTDTISEISATVGTNVIYGRAWELGTVPAWAGQHGWKFHNPTPKTRQGKQPARPFLRPAFENRREKIRLALQKAVTEGMAQGGFLGS